MQWKNEKWQSQRLDRQNGVSNHLRCCVCLFCPLLWSGYTIQNPITCDTFWRVWYARDLGMSTGPCSLHQLHNQLLMLRHCTTRKVGNNWTRGVGDAILYGSENLLPVFALFVYTKLPYNMATWLHPMYTKRNWTMKGMHNKGGQHLQWKTDFQSYSYYMKVIKIDVKYALLSTVCKIF